jgi:hypothetical protein
VEQEGCQFFTTWENLVLWNVQFSVCQSLPKRAVFENAPITIRTKRTYVDRDEAISVVHQKMSSKFVVEELGS